MRFVVILIEAEVQVQIGDIQKQKLEREGQSCRYPSVLKVTPAVCGSEQKNKSYSNRILCKAYFRLGYASI